MEDTKHIPVLMKEVLDGLNLKRGGKYLDCTFGGGGHSGAILQHPNLSLVALDRDPQAAIRAEKYGKNNNFTFINQNFADISNTLAGEKFDGILADLGVSTDQILGDRGFSFQNEQILDMRMNPTESITAEKIVNNSTEYELVQIFRRGGMQQEAKFIAREIVRRRPIQTTFDLVEIAKQCQPRSEREKRRNPATLLFQVLRIEVNQEINSLRDFLKSVPVLAQTGTRLVIICFHSLEDQIVTKTLRSWSSGSTAPANWRGPQGEKKLGNLLTRKAVTASEDELNLNPSSRSALLRVFEFI